MKIKWNEFRFLGMAKGKKPGTLRESLSPQMVQLVEEFSGMTL
jgi:hypothetical protein